MVTDWDVYCAFRKAQSLKNDKPYRLPKDWEAFKAKMNAQNLAWLERMTMYFNTTFSNIDVDQYMVCGFEVHPNFTYKNFIDSRIMGMYIAKDKSKKRRMDIEQKEIDDTFSEIRAALEGKPTRTGYGQLQNFCKFRDGEQRIIINMYMRGKVDPMTLTYCIVKRYLILSDDERALVPYISQRYRELVEKLCDVQRHIERKERELNGN